MKKTSYDYFDFFEDMIECGCGCAGTLKQIFGTYSYGKLDSYKEQMHDLERAADQKKHEMTEHLIKEFLPPIDREDITDIAHLLDEICDCVEEVMLLMYMNDIHHCRSDVYGMVDVVVEICDKLKEYLSQFRHFKKDPDLRRYTIEVNTLEEDGDRRYITAVRNLMIDGTDLREVTAWREIYTCIENCYDSCERVAEALEEVILKNS
ncbi:MAG: DUF47 family protein [Bacillota bacterium]|nr:DUF47 family protein [Bacillota bacterium]